MNVVTLQELSGDEITSIIELALVMKERPGDYAEVLADRSLLMLFQKTSTRTRLSFELAIKELGGRAVVMDWDTSNFAISAIEHEARYVSKHVDVILARLLHHEDMVRLAAAASVPTINGCCNRYHPTEALTDLMTVYEAAGTFTGVTLGYIGMYNNVVNALVAGCLRVGLKLVLVVPGMNQAVWDAPLMQEALDSGWVTVTSQPTALAQANFVYTDTWVDMERFHDPEYAQEKKRLLDAMMPYQLRAELFAGSNPYIMHDMPVHPGLEIEESLIESEKSLIYEQAANKLHAGKSLMVHLLEARVAAKG